jgi:acetylornithine deacetylase/succinyl-diaminopimelate desuccinylase-like protein
MTAGDDRVRDAPDEDAAGATGEAGAIRERVAALMPTARRDLARLVAFRSVADERQVPREELRRTAVAVRDLFRDVGVDDVELHPTPDGTDAVIGRAPGPPGAPTVLLYTHYDVQPPLGEEEWTTPVWELTERDGRWYGRGAADCKGNLVAHLTALRALGGALPVGLVVVVEGSEEQATGGLEAFVREHPELLGADAILVCDTGNVAAGVPTLTTSLRGVANVVVTVRTLGTAVHSGMFGGAAPDALAALLHTLASLRDADGNTTVRGLDASGGWRGAAYPVERFRQDASVLEGVDVLGSGSVADMLWARPAVTVLGIDAPPVVGSTAAVQPSARARVSLRVPPGTDAIAAQDALVEHLRASAPWHARVEVEREAVGQPFTATVDGPAYRALRGAMEDAFGHELATVGQGASIPLCSVLRETSPDAAIFLMGVEEPRSRIHAPDESVDPREIERVAVATALFLERYGSAGTSPG